MKNRVLSVWEKPEIMLFRGSARSFTVIEISYRYLGL